MCDIKQHILEFPYPPSVNAYWLQSGRRRYISKRGVEFKSAVANICNGLQGFGDSQVEVSIVLYPRDKRLLDIDNCCKAILDSMQGYMYEDDQQVWKLTVERGEKIKNGGCKVTINKYNKDCFR
jgi:crossover junction endodeoxyribonuclease RusA